MDGHTGLDSRMLSEMHCAESAGAVDAAAHRESPKWPNSTNSLNARGKS